MNEQAALDELFGLMKIARTQQEAVQTALDGLAAERAALAKERAALAAMLSQQVEAVKGAAGSVTQVAASIQQAANHAIPAIEKAAGQAVAGAVRASLAEVSETAATAIDAAAQPVIDQLDGMAKAAGNVERQLRKAGAWATWKVGVALGGGALLVALVAWGATERQRHEFERLLEEKSDMQANVAALKKKGGRIQLTTCTDANGTNRLCIPVSTNQGAGYEHFTAPFSNSQSGDQFVIPKGY